MNKENKKFGMCSDFFLDLNFFKKADRCLITSKEKTQIEKSADLVTTTVLLEEEL